MVRSHLYQQRADYPRSRAGKLGSNLGEWAVRLVEGHAVLNEQAHLRGRARGCPRILRILKHPGLENQAGPGLRREASPNCKAPIIPG